jgi:hypothetical protein
MGISFLVIIVAVPVVLGLAGLLFWGIWALLNRMDNK